VNNREILATNLRALMEQAGITSQTQLARACNVSQTQISNILSQKKSATVDILERLTEGLNCERWLLLAPVKYLQNLEHVDFEPLVHCYLRLSPSAQDAVWEMIHQLYEANNMGYLGKH